MVFNSFDFLLFFPIVVAIYFVIPKKVRYIWLLIASYYFYMSWNPKYAILIALSTLITYVSGISIEYFQLHNRNRIAKICVTFSLISNLGILGLFKYADFFLDNLSAFLNKIGGVQFTDKRLDLLLPVGISFYTFQALSYTLDVYRKDVKAEKNVLRYALFVSFFPQLVAGPIERSKNLLGQIQNVEKIQVWNYTRIRDGFFLMLWGFFQKIVIADRASIIVDEVINNYSSYGFVEIIFATAIFAIQIYCDFGGYTNIARGAARVMGFELMNNFRQPYLAKNIKEFWRRWHISLTSWFTDYLYIPLGGNRKGYFRKYLNIAIVFGASGLWHGASWNYIAWGLIHAFYQVIGDLKNRIEKRINIEKHSCISKTIREIFITFILVDFAWIFFASPSFRHALSIIGQMSKSFMTCGIQNLGLNVANLIVLGVSTVILFGVDIMHEKGLNIIFCFDKQEIWFKLLVIVGGIWSVILFGVYGYAYDPTTFIYFQF